MKINRCSLGVNIRAHFEPTLVRARRAKSCRAASVSLVPLILLLVSLAPIASMAHAGGDEFTGKFEPQLAPNIEDPTQVVFRPAGDVSRIKFAKPLESDAVVTVGRLYQASSEKLAILMVLVEPAGKDEPCVYADLDGNNVMDESERVQLKQTDSPQIWEATISEPLGDGPFKTYPVLVQYYVNTRNEVMKEGDRLVLETSEAFARGYVDIQGKKTLVEYAYNPRAKKINPNAGKMGLDSNGDGVIDTDRFSGEFAEANNEDLVFRAGASYVSTKRADLDKNIIVLKSHPASDYHRVELQVGGQMPDFAFVDFDNKKRKLSEFRGKTVLIDFWGLWCPACREEMPYLREAYLKYHSRGLEILGLNTDEPEKVPGVQALLQKNQMTWPQARRESITGVIAALRVSLFPTTLLIDPSGKIVSLDNAKRGQIELRGQDLLNGLDKVLPR